MAVSVIVGAQWGDEGKGKITDILAEKMDLVVRYQGGNNAGHTVVVGDTTFKLHLIPSGILYDTCMCIIANGVVIDIEVLLKEMDTLKAQGITVTPDRLKISGFAHVILPFHKQLDSQQEAKRHAEKIGTTGRGIGPCYTDKVARTGVRIIDLLNKSRLTKKIQKQNWGVRLGSSDTEIKQIIDEMYRLGQTIKPFVVDSSLFVNEAIDSNKNIIMEGAQGTMLDVDHGTYPFVTSSNPTSGGACIGAGVGPHKIHDVIGVTKAYVTRVGEGPFPTEQDNAVGEQLMQQGAEFGTTTGRKRRCGWLDLVGLKYAIRMKQYLSMVIPRGGAELINHVVEHATVPSIETGIGNCHVYIDAHANLGQAQAIAINAKTHRPSVCNACETILVHELIADRILPTLIQKLTELGVECRGCQKTQKLSSVKPAVELDWSMEFLDLIVAIKVVKTIDEAISHIRSYGSFHSEAIVSQDYGAINQFTQQIDAASILVNASTRFTDGGEFGYGAEMGISTQKLHARGPMGLKELTTTKYIVFGSGQIR